MENYSFLEDLSNLTTEEFRSVVDSVRSRIYTYRYIWKLKDADDGMLQIKYISDVRKAHEQFRDALLKDDDVVSALCEYVGEVDPSIVSITHVIKKEVQIEKEE